MKQLLLSAFLLLAAPDAQPRQEPIRIGVVGLVHGHVGWILNRPSRADARMVAIVERDTALVARFAQRYGFSPAIVYDSIDKMAANTQVDAITVFTSVYDPLAATEAAARHGIHVMVEKPMAISLDHAKRMRAVADSAGIHLLTNYETSWYPSVHYTHSMRAALGPLRKIVVRDGHPGPKEIGVGPEFLEWLTDPAKNGAGALMDFGCYGANLITWLMDGARPESVVAVAQTIKPDTYVRVDDEATIIVTYPETQGIIQASWNWPYNRKDLSVYGTKGYLHADNATDVRYRIRGHASEHQEVAAEVEGENEDPFSYLAGVVRGTIDPAQGLYSVEINMVAMEILDAALTSVRTGTSVSLSREDR